MITGEMTSRKVWLAVAAFVVLVPSAWAQYDFEPERWHLTGSAGFDFNSTSQRLLPSQTGSDQLSPLGDLRLNADGFLFDPKFLHINGGFDLQKGASNSEQVSFDNRGLGGSFSLAFLPRSHFPLRVIYSKTNYGINGLALNQDEDTSRLDLEWLAIVPKLPRISIGFQRYANDVQVPNSFSNRSFRDTGVNVGLSDIWRGWQWSGNAGFDQGSTTAVAGVSLSTPFTNSEQIGNFTADRSFWNQKAQLRFENRELFRHNSLDANASSDSRELTDTAHFDDRLTEKLSVNTGYSFSQVNFESSNFGALLPGAGLTQLIALTSNTSHGVTGGLSYRLKQWLRIGQEVRYTHVTPVATAAESRLSFTETESTVSADHRWHGLDLSGTYSGRFQVVSTTLGRLPNAWSNGFSGRIGWGDVRQFRLTGFYEHNRLNLVEQIGGFSLQKQARLEVESAWVKPLRLRASAERVEVGILNLTGSTDSRATAYAVSAEHRLFTLSFTAATSSGAGAIFPEGAIDRQLLIIPLPIAALVGTPLLNRDTVSHNFTILARPRRRLDASFTWRTERDDLFASNQSYDTIQAIAHYRIGKITLEGGFSNNEIDVLDLRSLAFLGSSNGDRLRRWYVRIARDFTVF